MNEMTKIVVLVALSHLLMESDEVVLLSDDEVIALDKKFEECFNATTREAIQADTVAYVRNIYDELFPKTDE